MKHFKMDNVDIDNYEVWTSKKGKESVGDNSYRGIKRVVSYTEELTDINADNIEEKIFNGFLWFRDKYLLLNYK